MAQTATRTTKGNLPAELTSFVGRRRELADIRSRLSNARLLGLTGAGGVGKTRLALHAGRELSRTLPDGVWLVDLQELRNANLVATAIMTALAVRGQSDRSPVSLLVDYLAERELLLILDNCEHLLDSCSVIVSAILHGTPGVRVLATSREPLNTDGEFVYPVAPLAVPDANSAASLDQLSQFEAVTLFCERASPTEPPPYDLYTSIRCHVRLRQRAHSLQNVEAGFLFDLRDGFRHALLACALMTRLGRHG